jgi:hypothetical protein
MMSVLLSCGAVFVLFASTRDPTCRQASQGLVAAAADVARRFVLQLGLGLHAFRQLV